MNLLTNDLPVKAGVDPFIMLVPDRPTPQVAEVVQRFSDHPRVHVQEPHVPVMSPEHGQKWIEVRNGVLDAFDNLGHTARWCANHDDDWLYGPGWDDPMTGVPACLTSDDVDSWRAISLFVWGQDAHGEANVNLRQFHNSGLFGRYQTGWRFDPTMTNQIVLEVEKKVQAYPERERVLPFFLIDCGTISDAERRHLYSAYANAGKLDAYTKKYIDMPKLKPLTEVYRRWPKPLAYWRMQVKEWEREQGSLDGKQGESAFVNSTG